MRTVLDHLVVACADLEQGSAWLREKLGTEPEPGGKHAAMGTHNRLLRLGERQYLELIAIDPDAEPPAHPRWFGLDEPSIRERASRAPFLLTWVAATDDLDEAVTRVPQLGAVREMSRGPWRWRIAVPEDGRLPFDGVMATLIQWSGPHPAGSLPDRGCELASLSPAHAAAGEIAVLLQVLEFEGWDVVEAGPRRLEAQVRTPSGLAALR
jgi:hypothetical protein